MRNCLLFALLGAVYIAVDGHLFTYQDDASGESSHFTPSYYVSRNPPGKYSPYAPKSYLAPAYPSYYVSRELPRWPQQPHGNGPLYDYSGEESYTPRSLYRSGRSKSKKGGGWGWNGGWWYKWTKHGLISGRWGAPPPPGLAKEHYLYGNHGGGGWGHGGGYGGGGGWGGWGSRGHGHGHGGHHFGGHGGHHFGGHGGHGGHGRGHGGHGGYGGGGGWGWGGGRTNGWGWEW